MRDSKGKISRELKLAYYLKTQTKDTSLSSDKGNSSKYYHCPSHFIGLDLSVHRSSHASQRLVASKKDFQLVWDITQPESSPLYQLPCNTPSRCVRWCNLHSGMDYFSRGTYNGDLKIYDLRQSNPKKSIWTAHDAHEGAIRDIRWNPFIPYWVATAGEDSIIRVWDIRMERSPVRELSNHLNSVNSISWSPTNCDILVSGGSDRRYNIWNLRSAPYYYVGTIETLDSSVVSVGFMNEKPIPPIFAVTSNGTIELTYLTFNFLSPMVPEMNNTSDKDINEVEKMIFCRNFEEGFKKAYHIAKKLQSNGLIKEANDLLNICYQRQSPVETSIAELAKNPLIDRQQFEKDLIYYSYYIPPNYADHLWPSTSKNLMFDIENLKLNLELEQYINDNNVKELCQTTTDIIEFLKRDENSIKIELLQQIVSAMMPYNYLMALDLVSQMSRVFNSKTPKLFKNICSLLLFPTIYETDIDFDTIYATDLYRTTIDGLLNASTMLGVQLDCTYLGDQIEFLKKFYEILWSQNPSYIIKLFDNSKSICISSTAVRIYLNQLLINKDFDKFYIKVTQFIERTKGYPFEDVLQRYLNSNVKKLQNYLKECYSGRINREDDDLLKKEPSEPSITKAKCLGHAGLMIINILCCSDTRHLPKQFQNVLTGELKQIQSDLENVLNVIKSKDNSDNFEDSPVVQVSNKILSKLKNYIKNKETTYQFSDLVNDFRNMLEHIKLRDADQDVNS